MTLDHAAFHLTRQNALKHLLNERNEQGHWTGRLSSSALSTATAITALSLIDRAHNATHHRELITGGVGWLINKQNDDGGWGDTDKSFSNISTTMLCWAALNLPEVRSACDSADLTQARDSAEQQTEAWLANHAGSTDIPTLVQAVMQRYGKDRTFSVPILTMCALCGRLGDPDSPQTWKYVKQLPFELAAFPARYYAKLNLRVVSYALPALIAIGQLRHTKCPTRNPITRITRALTKNKTLDVLSRIQPPNGGFLEATPLTSFVTMALAGANLADHPVATKAVSFLIDSARPDGSWAIDTNLATWVTTLSVNALAAGGNLNQHLNEQERQTITHWLLDQQYTEVHPYTNAEPGGWAWTDLPGGVPDADDTAGALISLINLNTDNDTPSPNLDERTKQAGTNGLRWLESLQNRDGGIPTFCRGWGKLPFDRSSTDITAHFIGAHLLWAPIADPEGFAMMAEQDDADQPVNEQRPSTPTESTLNMLQGGMPGMEQHLGRALFDRCYGKFNKAIGYIRNQQLPDGSWHPLWFGNQHLDTETNPTYATARILEQGIGPHADSNQSISWLLATQNNDGGWGGGHNSPSSIEETALTLQAVIETHDGWLHFDMNTDTKAAIQNGLNYLIQQTNQGTHFPPSPIGFYFAKLWYYEKLYPVIFTVAAMERAAVWLDQLPHNQPTDT